MAVDAVEMSRSYLKKVVSPRSAAATAYFLARNKLADFSHRKSANSVKPRPLSSEERSYLSKSNPFLRDLRHRYRQQALFTHTFWSSWRVDLTQFRGGGHYLTQGLDHNPEAQYLASTAYVELVDDWKLLRHLGEDGLFGCHAYKFGEIDVSRDLLDSILEISFLRRALDLKRDQQLKLLDIGSGYGRFAHRFLSTFPQASIANVDGVPESTFLCDFYTRFRNLGDRCKVIPADQLDQLPRRCDLALNIHSWSECPRATVKFWVRLLRDLDIRYLFVVPHDEEFSTMELKGRTDTFLPEITAAGYKVIYQAHKFDGSTVLQQYGLCPARYFLFEAR